MFSYIIQYPKPTQLAISVPDGKEITYSSPEKSPILNISSNLYMGMNGYGLIQDNQGNFSISIKVPPGSSVTVSMLDSCCAIFLISEDFDSIAAGHMSGDAVFVEDWCKKLSKSSAPKYLIWGFGGKSSLMLSQKVLAEYIKCCNIEPKNVFAVYGCGSIQVQRSSGGAVVYASLNS
jgi:hypothetical protein